MGKVKVYGKCIGQVVTARVDLATEYRELVPAGTKLRIVAIAPKVMKKRSPVTEEDRRDYFFNLVKAAQPSDDGNRIRVGLDKIK